MGHSCFSRLRQVVAGNTQEGIQKYFEALKVDPHYAPAYYNLGVVYSEMMEYDMALTSYEKASSERPMYAESYCNMGVIYKNLGDLEAAITCYERCLAVSPNFEIAKNNMAIALTDLGTKVKLEGDINRSVAFYIKALFYNWHYVDAMYNLGVAYGSIITNAPNFDNSPDSGNDIEEAMIRAATEASKRKAEENYNNHELGRQVNLSEFGPNPRQTFVEDPWLAHAISLSLKTTE
ncbi:hypothetical protein RYX36_009963 [Vicia faba]